MKRIKLFGLISLGIIIYSCSGENTKSNHVDNNIAELDGEELMKKNCLICHGNGTSHDDILAPPMRGVKNHYLTDEMTEEEFVNAILNWTNNPSEENAKMPGAVNRFGVMPKQQFEEQEVKAIAVYMYNNEMPKPVWFEQHMKEKHGENGFIIEGLELDNGEKWKANAETTEGINNMIALTADFPENPTIEVNQNLGLS